MSKDSYISKAEKDTISKHVDIESNLLNEAGAIAVEALSRLLDISNKLRTNTTQVSQYVETLKVHYNASDIDIKTGKIKKNGSK